MEYKRIDNVIVARIDRGEEILKAISLIARAENIKLANINALGALSEFTVGVYNVEKRQYFKNDFSGAYEIVSLTGSINTMDGKYYSHLHLCAADEKGQAFGGHLNRAIISATCEMFIYILDGTVDRFRDPVTGLNLFKF
ncbi:MAG: DNA-binding protein [Erysipelotrichaceae bacterium]|nr:DNA-binding protein [Erysipelotrichaceae bacterium]